ncbi:YdeI/OmpD-associated family protein [Algoriphagus sp.]|uniref:YdeI/OmpD-associated family protein n=1 Tax=Algoriphagus sp. TaxID=1872435 RepID=UPI0025F5E468|nr:YdeI/OmpD-associated family protein [Algoriphagus sp.]
MIVFQGKLESFDFNHWSFHVPVPESISKDIVENYNRRVLVKINDQGPWHMALMKAKTYWYILINQEIRKTQSLEVGDLLSISLEKDASEYGHELPEEFQVLMDQDEEGYKYFKSLTPGKQRSLVYIVTKVKNPESRMKKSLAIMHHLRLAKGKLDFKQLNEMIKHYNNL